MRVNIRGADSKKEEKEIKERVRRRGEAKE